MCNAMNGSLVNVIFGAFMKSSTSGKKAQEDERVAKVSNAEDAAFLMQMQTLY